MRAFTRLAALAAACAALAACTDNELYKPTPEEAKQNLYTNAFIQEFGKPAANQAWGFYDVPTAQSRAAVDLSAAWTDTRRNEWWKQIAFNDIPRPVSEEETARVRDAFRDESVPYCDLGLMNDFFCQHVFAAHRTYKVEKTNNGSGQVGYDDVDGSNLMDYLYVYSTGNGTALHVNDFNASGAGNTSEVYKNDHEWEFKDNSMLVHNAKSDQFSFHDSKSDQLYHTFKVKEVDGQYYLGFHYSIPRKNMGGETIELKPSDNELNGYFADGEPIYDDWIIKVCPAPYSSNGENGGRVFAEDLGDVGDWDFNDVVFDVVFTEQDWSAGVWPAPYTKPVLTIRAAGGTLPLTVAGYEVHEAFGVPVSQMVNTGGEGGVKRPAVVIRLAEDYGGKLADIPVVVTQEDGTKLELKARVGAPASKLLGPTTVEWMRERQHICTVYPRFKTYVGQPDVKWWQNP